MIVDSHCHIPHKKYENSAEEIIKRAKNAGVTKLINIGTSLNENEKAINVSSTYENVFSAIAVYPHENQDKKINELHAELEKQFKSSSKIVAIGECGLDIGGLPYERKVDEQVELFEMLLDLACQKNLPVIIHNRNGDHLIMEILDKFISKGLTGVAHCFSSSWEVAQQYLDRGFYLSFSGMITYKARQELRDVVAKVPESSFLIETDAPHLPPEGYRGKPNEPAFVVEVAKKIAEIRGVPFDKIAELSYSNSHKLFKNLN